LEERASKDCRAKPGTIAPDAEERRSLLRCAQCAAAQRALFHQREKYQYKDQLFHESARKLYAIEPNHGELDVISTDGTIRRVADISATQGHIVPTAIAYHGNFFVGNLNTFPIQEGSSKILKITPSGQVKTVVTGVTTVLGVAFDREGNLYILENTPTPFTGKVLRVTDDGFEEIATGCSCLPQ